MLGKQKHTIDAKNRIFLPSKFRAELGSELVISKSITGECIRVYSLENWNKFEEKIRSLPEIESDEEVWWILTNAENIHVDDQGRIAIPQDYREYAHLDKDIISAGRGERMEIWDAKIFEEKQAAVDVSKLREALKRKGF